MTTKQIDEMLTELSQMEHPRPISYQLPTPPDYYIKTRPSNQQLIRSVLYLGHILRRSQVNAEQKGDFVVDSLESLTSVLWITYISLQNLVLGRKRLVLNVIRLMRLKAQVLAEVNKIQLYDEINPLRAIFIEQYQKKIDDLTTDMRYEVLELAGTLVDLAFVSVELFHWKINPTLERILGFISAGMSMYRMSR
ncbi:hypothetical protein BON22_5247 [Cyberlindnera fabianii]|uniref:Uncharacterized protein n=1 Tax=Cyberlindnera fabianii TaxID=36022 RepID=A0A1V2L043_CYBFA|nr:hypothetical protein BON22_5247 [Cyberlindnera fabianii]